MSYARKGLEGSDVYVYSDGDNYICHECKLGSGRHERRPTPGDMLAHLGDHTLAGHCVPPYATGRLRADAQKHPTGPEPWCEPWSAGLASKPRAVARRLGELLTALSRVDSNIVRGTLPNELWEYRISLHERLKAEGWRITGTANGWRVLPPLTKRARRSKVGA